MVISLWLSEMLIGMNPDDIVRKEVQGRVTPTFFVCLYAS